MEKPLRTALFFFVTAALGFGFLHHLTAKDALPDFLRLHIFWFNLVSGGSVILFRVSGRAGKTLAVFFFTALIFSLAAAFNLYLLSIACALVLFGVVESVRIPRFSLFPVNFFTRAPVSEKFMQASLLCLSIGLLLCSLAMANQSFGHWFSAEKFSLNTFFLGFSFPVSLITFSVIMEDMKGPRRTAFLLQNACFWVINLGVITFFLFILTGKKAAQIGVSSLLTAGVLCALVLYSRLAESGQKKAILSSGMIFLLATAASGIAYIIAEFFPQSAFPGDFTLRLHAFVSLYGWNLSGLIVIARLPGFPLALPLRRTIALHWAVVAVLCPLGYFYPAAAVCAVALFAVFLRTCLFSKRAAPAIA
ncbi:MAG: hypothetical protein AB1921_09950 [Thermodesulfobacteriota bacterium]